MKAYYDPWFLWLLACSMWASAPQCTRCGGQHSVSRRPWPVAKEGGHADQA